jgi:hypothetical protein
LEKKDDFKKKNYTESNPRIETEPISEYKFQDEEDPSHAVYLV